MTKLLLVALLALIPLTSHAQQDLGEKEDLHWRLTEEQTIASLTHSLDTVGAKSLENTIVFAVLYRDKMNFHRLVGPVIDLHKRSKNPDIEDLALATLHVIGTDRSLAYVARAAADDRDRSRLLAMEVLDNYLARGSLAAR